MVKEGVNVSRGRGEASVTKNPGELDAADILALSFPVIILVGILALARNRAMNPQDGQ